MTEPRRLIGFSFTYCNRRPTSIGELNADSWLRLQNALILQFARTHDHDLIQRLPGFSVGRRKSFTQIAPFQRAVALARAEGADLIVGYLQELLNRTPAELVAGCIATLEELEVDVWDARSMATWKSLSTSRRKMIEDVAMTSSQARSSAIRTGLKMAKRDRSSSSKNAARASAVNVVMANKRAEDLRAIIEEERSRMPAGTRLSPSMLARRLNQEGVPAPRGGTWSHNSAKNLLSRLEPALPDAGEQHSPAASAIRR